MKREEISTSNCEDNKIILMTDEEQKELLNDISSEGNKDYNIIEIKDIPSFDVNKFEELNKLSYYSKRKILDEILKNKEIASSDLVKILNHDDIYDKVQNLYLDELITSFNQINIGDIMKNKIIEKIQKIFNHIKSK